MNKCIVAFLVVLMSASVACANETLWNAVKKAYDSGLEEDWKAVEVIMKTDKTIDKYYAPEGEQAVFHYVVAACQFALAEMLVEMDPSVIEVPPGDEDPSAQSLILESLLDDEMDHQAARARADARIVPRSTSGW